MYIQYSLNLWTLPAALTYLACFTYPDKFYSCLLYIQFTFYTINMIIVNVVVVVHPPPIHLVTAGGECGGPRGLEVLSPLAETVVPELEDFSQLKGTTTTTLCES